MGKGSTTVSSMPTFRTGTIRTPADPRVTERKSVKTDIIAPDVLIDASAKQFWYGSPSIGEVCHGPALAQRESLDSERANVTPVVGGVVSLDKRGGLDVLVSGKHKGLRGVVRTVAMGDEALPSVKTDKPAAADKSVKTDKLPKGDKSDKPVKAVKSVDVGAEARRAAQAEQNRAIRAYLDSLGYKGPLTAKVRELALDTLAHAATVAAYAAEPKRSNKGVHVNGR